MTSVCVVGLETLAVRHGGLNRYVAEYVEALEERGHEVTLVAVGAPGTGPTASGSKMPSVARRLWWTARAARRARKATVLDVHFALYGLIPALTRRRGQRLVVHFHGPWAHESAVSGARPSSVRVKAFLERALYRRADAVVVLSRAFADEVCARYGVQRDVVSIIAPGVNSVRFNAERRVPPEVPTIVTVRRLVERTGVDVAIRAAAVLRDQGIAFQLVIAGDGPARSDLEALVAHHHLGSHVRFVGRLSDDELPALYRAATVTVVPSTAYEGFGLVTLESLACGTPVVASAIGGLIEVLSEFDEDLLVPAGNAGALAARLRSALVEHALPDARACVAYAERFSWSKLAAAHEPVLWPSHSHKLRVCFIGHTAIASGGELALVRQLPALDAIEPLVILGADGPLVERLEELEVRVIVDPLDPRLRDTRRADVLSIATLPRQVLSTAGAIVRLVRLLRKEQIDIVHTNTLKAALYAGLAGRLARVPVVWHLRDRIAPDYLPVPVVALVRVLARLLPSAIIANSASTLATVPHGRHGVVIPSPLDPALVHISAHHADPMVVVMVGRLAPWKGQALFIDAFANAFRDSDVRARIVGAAMFGEADYEAALNEQIAASSTADRISMVGFSNDVAQEFANASIAVVASLSPEPFGNVVIEAMACGAAVIAPDAGGPQEVIESGVNGLLFEPGNVASLTHALQTMWRDSVLRARCAQRGIAVSRRYLPDALEPQYMAVYEMIAATRLPRR